MVARKQKAVAAAVECRLRISIIKILKKSLNITLSRTLLAGGSLVYVMLQREGMSLHDALANATTVLSRP